MTTQDPRIQEISNDRGRTVLKITIPNEFGPPQEINAATIYDGRINWSAIGPASPATTKLMAKVLQRAAEIAETDD